MLNIRSFEGWTENNHKGGKGRYLQDFEKKDRVVGVDLYN